MATRLLAEAGHRLVRIEPTSRRRRAAASGRFCGGQQDVEHGAYHQFLNAGKESIALDLDTPKGREVLRALAAKADCAIVTQPFAIDAEWFLNANPKIAVVEVDDVGNELCDYARSGLLSLTGHPDGKPVLLGGHAVLSVIGLYVAVAASAALMAAQISGEGQHVEVSAEQCMEFDRRAGAAHLSHDRKVTESPRLPRQRSRRCRARSRAPTATG